MCFLYFSSLVFKIISFWTNILCVFSISIQALILGCNTWQALDPIHSAFAAVMDPALVLFTFTFVCLSLMFGVCPPQEFWSSGVTLENLLSRWLGREEESFVLYNVRRLSASLLFQACLPLRKRLLRLIAWFEKLVSLLWIDWLVRYSTIDLLGWLLDWQQRFDQIFFLCSLPFHAEFFSWRFARRELVHGEWCSAARSSAHFYVLSLDRYWNRYGDFFFPRWECWKRSSMDKLTLRSTFKQICRASSFGKLVGRGAADWRGVQGGGQIHVYSKRLECQNRCHPVFKKTIT